jgi:hypothetical protein
MSESEIPVMPPPPSEGTGEVVSATPEGQFIVEYIGTAMMDSRCSYSSEMMPWVIAEILRFSGNTQVANIQSSLKHSYGHTMNKID